MAAPGKSQTRPGASEKDSEARFIKFAGVDRGAIVFILDTSDSAQQKWDEIVDTLMQWRDHLPPHVPKKIYFLGSAQEFQEDWRDLRQAGAAATRGSFITPVFEELKKIIRRIPISRVVLMVSGRVFDLADWQEPPLRVPFLLINFGDAEILPTGSIEVFRPNEDVIPKLYGPVTQVEWQGPGFMPLMWDNQSYRFSLEDGRAYLRATEASNYQVTLAYLNISQGLPKVIIRRRDDQLEEGQWLEGGEIKDNPWRSLEQAEAAVFRQASQGLDYQCLHCAQTHAAEQVKCFEEDFLGRLIYPSLENDGAEGFILFRPRNGVVKYQVRGSPVMALQQLVVVKEPKGNGMSVGRIYRYYADQDRWQPYREFKNYTKLRDGRNREYWMVIL